MKKQILKPAAGAALCAALFLAGCAQVPPNAGENPVDPYEAFNRNVYAFNDALDRAVAKPVAEASLHGRPASCRPGFRTRWTTSANLRTR